MAAGASMVVGVEEPVAVLENLWQDYDRTSRQLEEVEKRLDGLVWAEGEWGEELEKVLEDAVPGDKTRGKTRNYEKEGGMDKANEDFDKLNPTDVKPIQTRYGPGRTGKLSDGTSVNVRPGSSPPNNQPTIEIQLTKNKYIKVRY